MAVRKPLVDVDGKVKRLPSGDTVEGAGTVDTSTIGAVVNGAAAATPNNTDLVATVESSVVKKITWTNVKAFLKTYFDTLYPSGSGTHSGTSSGTNTGDQTITLTGNVTGSGTGSFAATIANGAVSLAKMADMATTSLIYRKTAGTGAPEVQTLATLKTDLGLTGTNSGDQTTITGNAGSATVLQTTRTIWGQNFNGSANVSGTLALGASDLTLTGSIGATGARATKLWATDAEFTNAPTLGGSAPTGSAGLVRATSPTITTPQLSGVVRVGTGTQSAWTLFTGILDSGGGSLAFGSGVPDVNISSNAYFSTSWKYYSAATAVNAYLSGGDFVVRAAASGSANAAITWATKLTIDNTGIGFFGGSAAAKPTVTGSRGGNAALASLLTALAGLGLLTDSSSA